MFYFHLFASRITNKIFFTMPLPVINPFCVFTLLLWFYFFRHISNYFFRHFLLSPFFHPTQHCKHRAWNFIYTLMNDSMSQCLWFELFLLLYKFTHDVNFPETNESTENNKLTRILRKVSDALHVLFENICRRSFLEATIAFVLIKFQKFKDFPKKKPLHWTPVT